MEINIDVISDLTILDYTSNWPLQYNHSDNDKNITA